MTTHTTHTITTTWVKIEGEDRLRIGIDLEHDFATIYLHPETVESLRVALGAIPARPASGPRFWDVVIDGSKPVRAVGDNEDDAIERAAMHLYPEACEFKRIEGEEFEGLATLSTGAARVRITAIAILVSESK